MVIPCNTAHRQTLSLSSSSSSSVMLFDTKSYPATQHTGEHYYHHHQCCCPTRSHTLQHSTQANNNSDNNNKMILLLLVVIIISGHHVLFTAKSLQRSERQLQSGWGWVVVVGGGGIQNFKLSKDARYVMTSAINCHQKKITAFENFI